MGGLRRTPRRGRRPPPGATLALEEVPAYLLGLGLLSPADLVDGGITVADVSRRNRNYRVLRRGGGGCLVKQGLPGPEGETVRREARLLGACAPGNPLSALAPVVPRRLAHDAGRRILVTGLVAGGRQFWRLVAAGEEAASAAGHLGAALALVHRQPAPPWRGEAPAPWVLGIARPSLDHLGALGPAHLALLRIVQGDEPLQAGLDLVRRDWRSVALIHGDVKGDNVLHLGDGPPPGGGVRLVDWESAQRGDPAWDLGSGFHDLLLHWLRSIPLAAGSPLGEQLALARRPLGRLRPAIRALWHAYRRAAGLEDGAAADLLVRSVRCCGARLVQAAYEEGTEAEHLPNAAVAMLQLASNLLADPEPAAFGLLGIPWPALPPAAGPRSAATAGGEAP